MDMQGERGELRLVYQTTVADVAQAIRVRDAKLPAGRRRRLMLVCFGVMLVCFGGLALLGHGPIGRPLGFLGGGVLLLAVTLLGPQLTARAFAGLLAKAGETTALVTATGLRLSTENTEARIDWAAQPMYTETADHFITLSVAKRAAAMTILPKRGAADPADIDRLRALLDQNLQRI
ncbi:hypothetical protein ACFXDJ_22845 [Streptomyces sp. NPDC059443]|uniref:hypothetical protein n=1 Tax=unclassified Streptomyces TaxID=2593676 RepID=UPI0036B5C870